MAGAQAFGRLRPCRLRRPGGRSQLFGGCLLGLRVPRKPPKEFKIATRDWIVEFLADAEVPAGATPGPVVPVVVQIGKWQSQPGVTMAVR